MPETARACPNCRTPLPTYAAFCYACGAATPAGIDRQTGEFVVPEITGISMDEVLAKLRRQLGPAYELGERIGAGGFAEVFLARDLRLKRDVAVKVTRPDFAVNALMMQRFRREAEVIAALRHPHIMPIYDLGEADGIAYIVMPYIRGESLKARMDRLGRMPVELSRRILLQTADALSAAHEAGVVHRDVKPDNIMLDRRDDQVLLMDFGIAKAIESGVDGHSISLTSTGLVMGTPHYMSPEQAAGERSLDHRSDQYALAVVTYRMLAGVLPFDGPTVRAILAKQLVGAATPLREVARDVPAALVEAIERAMSKEPDERFPSVRAFMDAVRADPTYAAEVVRPTGGVPPYTPQVAIPAVPLAASEPPPRRRSRMWWMVGGALTAVAAAGAAFVATRPDAAPPARGVATDSALPLPVDAVLPPSGEPLTTRGDSAAGAVTDSAATDSVARRRALDSAIVVRAGLRPGTPAADTLLLGMARLRRRSCEAWFAAGRDAEARTACLASLRTSRSSAPTAQRVLGALAERAGRADSAARWYELAAASDPEAAARLAQLLDSGRGLTADPARAADLLRRAADAGHVPSQRTLAERLAQGRGLRKDEAAALTWYGRAAGSGDLPSMLALGNAYKDGRGVKKNEGEAAAWWQKAAALGDAESQYRLGMAYLRGQGVPKSDSVAIEWHRKAAAQGNGGSIYELRKRKLMP